MKNADVQRIKTLEEKIQNLKTLMTIYKTKFEIHFFCQAMNEIGFYEHYIMNPHLQQSINDVHDYSMGEELSKSDLGVKKKSFSRKQTYSSKSVICLWSALTFGILVRFVFYKLI